MNRILSLIGVVLVVGCSEPIPRNIDELMRQGETYLDPETFEPYSGPVGDFFPGNSLKIQVRLNLKDGVPDGPFENYRGNGQLMWKGTYKDGELCGEWFEDGETVTYDPCPPSGN